MTLKRDKETIQRLADAFDKAQRVAPDEWTIDVARKIATASEPIWQAAVYWLEHGEMPDEPMILGYTPKSLHRAKGLVPSAALTALMALEEDASGALVSLGALDDKGPDAGKYPSREPGHPNVPDDAISVDEYIKALEEGRDPFAKS